MNKTNNELSNNNSPSEQLMDNLSQGKLTNQNELVEEVFRFKEEQEKKLEKKKEEEKEKNLQVVQLLRELALERDEREELESNMENMRYKSIIDKEVANRRTVTEAPLTADQIISNSLSKVINKRKEQALELKRRRDEREKGSAVQGTIPFVNDCYWTCDGTVAENNSDNG